MTEDNAEAVKWYCKAADQGHAEAQNNLGWMYANGDGVPQDDVAAVKWYHMAAEQGHVEAQFNLGLRYYHGKGVPEDNAEAVKWYRKAADQGYARAQFRLGYMYVRGEGVPQDFTEAVKWWRKAAEQGYADALEVLEDQRMAKAIPLCPKCGELVLHIFRCTECENYLEEEWDLRHLSKYPPDPPKYDEKTGRIGSRQCRECGNNTFEPEEESEYCSGCEHFLEREMEA